MHISAHPELDEGRAYHARISNPNLKARFGLGHRIWNFVPRIGPFDSGSVAVIPEKSGIQRILGPGNLSFGQTFRIPACAGKKVSPETLVVQMRWPKTTATRLCTF